MIRLREEFLDHPKFADLSPDAIVLWLGALGYCRLHQTDGWVPERVAVKLARGTKKPALVLGELIVPPPSSPHLRPLLEKCEAGYRMVGYLDHNESKAELDENRRGKAEAGALGGRASGEARAKQSASEDRSSRARPIRSDPVHTDPNHTDPGSTDEDTPDEPEQLALVPEASKPAKPPPKAHPEREVFDAYLAARAAKGMKGHPPVLTEKRRQLVKMRLKDHPLDQLIAAARGIWASSFHVEKGYTEFDLAMRDAEHVERFAATTAPPPPPPQVLPPHPPPPKRTPAEHVAEVERRMKQKFEAGTLVGSSGRPFASDQWEDHRSDPEGTST